MGVGVSRLAEKRRTENINEHASTNASAARQLPAHVERLKPLQVEIVRNNPQIVEPASSRNAMIPDPRIAIHSMLT